MGCTNVYIVCNYYLSNIILYKFNNYKAISDKSIIV